LIDSRARGLSSLAVDSNNPALVRACTSRSDTGDYSTPFALNRDEIITFNA
jgi:hypothetical protein